MYLHVVGTHGSLSCRHTGLQVDIPRTGALGVAIQIPRLEGLQGGLSQPGILGFVSAGSRRLICSNTALQRPAQVEGGDRPMKAMQGASGA